MALSTAASTAVAPVPAPASPAGLWGEVPLDPPSRPARDGGLRKVIAEAAKQGEMVTALKAFQHDVGRSGNELKKIGEQLARLGEVPSALRAMSQSTERSVSALCEVVKLLERRLDPPSPTPVPGAPPVPAPSDEALPYLRCLNDARDQLCDGTPPNAETLKARLQEIFDPKNAHKRLPADWRTRLGALADRFVQAFAWTVKEDSPSSRLQRVRDIHLLEAELMRLFEARSTPPSTPSAAA